MKTKADSEVVRLVGQLIAEGYSAQGVYKALSVEPFLIPREDISVAIKEVYESWRREDEELNLDLADYRRYHLEMRHRLLVSALATSDSAQSLRLALSILESMATLQNLSEGNEHERSQHDLTITLVPAQNTESGKKEGDEGGSGD